jgi:hypothetical protein
MKRIVSSLAFAAGMLASSAFAATTTYTAVASGPGEATPVASPGYSIATLVIDDVANTLQLSSPFTQLLGTTVGAHIHAATAEPLTGTADVAVHLDGFPMGVQAGDYSITFNLLDATTYDAAYLSANGGTAQGARDSLLADINENRAYLNIHTNLYPAGEIRGFIVANPIPEPSTYAMLAVGLAGVAFVARRKRKQAETA